MTTPTLEGATPDLAAPDPAAQHPLLVTTGWLAQRLGAPGLVLIDVSEPAAFERAHVLGAVGVPAVPGPLFKGRNSLLVMPAAEFEDLAQRLGVSNDSQVVLYDGGRNRLAARGWWTFEHYGLAHARILDGGISAWLAEGRPVTQEATTPPRGDFSARAVPEVLCTLDDLRSSVEAGAEGRIWDVRADDEWDGTGARGNARTGRVPGARHLEWVHLVEDAPAHRFLPLEEMRARLDAAGIDPAAIEAVYCQGGIRAALGTFVLRLLGNDRARNYDGSMAEWANREDTPLER